jgi:hypothetical protein
MGTIQDKSKQSGQIKSYEDFKALMKGLPPKAPGQILHPLIFEVLLSTYKTSVQQSH